jgi:hypothetical protein
MKSLAEVLSYQNDEVVFRFMGRFARDYGLSEMDARDVFLETKRWLWLCASSQKGPVQMIGEAFVIDEMWHTFLLFTQDYAEFCEHYFSKPIHHVPKKLSELEDQNWRDSLRKHYELIYDELGPAVLIKWSKIYPEKFEALRPQ